MRPAPGYADYRTPIAGLYNASSATHAGGGVCGIPGLQAAKAAIGDRAHASSRLRGVLSRTGR
jgi:phytoene dehydrogenase-like protein